MKKILMILTNHRDMLNTDTKTGVWLGEFTDPYYVFTENGYTVELASPKGGEPPIDEGSRMTENISPANRKFQEDQELQQKFSHTKKLSEIKVEDYDALFLPGGHGPIFDLAKDYETGKTIVDFYHSGKPVSAVCHGSAAFLATELVEKGFLNGTKMTCFSNTEEKLVGKTENVPYLLEDELEKLGVEIKNALIPFVSNVEVDGKIVTGQNPFSAGPTAKKLIEIL